MLLQSTIDPHSITDPAINVELPEHIDEHDSPVCIITISISIYVPLLCIRYSIISYMKLFCMYCYVFVLCICYYFNLIILYGHFCFINNVST